MLKILNLFVDICFFRRGPQDLPASQTILLASVAAYAASGLLVLPTEMPFSIRFLHTGTDVLLLFGLTWLLLTLRGMLARLPQTIGALAGTGTLLQLVAWPLVTWLTRGPPNGEQVGWPMLLFVALFGWSIAVTAHIIRQAIEVNRAQSLLIVMVYLVASIFLTNVVLARLG